MNTNNILATFYFQLLAVPYDHEFRIRNQKLYSTVRASLAFELNEEEETVQRVFERIANV